MPVEVLIHAITHRKAQKGFIQTVMDQPVVWGRRETLPNYVVLTIPDATKAEVDTYTNNWVNTFSYELLGSNAAGRRYKMSVNPKVVTDFGIDKGFGIEIKNYVVSEYGAVLVNAAVNQEWATFDIPNPTAVGWTLYAQQIKADLLDVFETQVATRRYIFSPADVDIAVAAGGFIEITKAQAIARIVDRLA